MSLGQSSSGSAPAEGVSASALTNKLHKLQEEEVPDPCVYEESGPKRAETSVAVRAGDKRKSRKDAAKDPPPPYPGIDAPSSLPPRSRSGTASGGITEHMARMEERNRRVSRTAMQQQVREQRSVSTAVPGRRKISRGMGQLDNAQPPRKLSQNVLGFEAKANYMTRWLIAYGGADQLESGLREDHSEPRRTSRYQKHSLQRHQSHHQQPSRSPTPARRSRVDSGQRSSRMEERNKRVSRIEMHHDVYHQRSRNNSTNIHSQGATPQDSPVTNKRSRQVSTSSFTGINRRAGYMARYIMAHGEPRYQHDHSSSESEDEETKIKNAHYNRSGSIYDSAHDFGFQIRDDSRRSSIGEAAAKTPEQTAEDVAAEQMDDVSLGSSQREEDYDIEQNAFVEFLYSISPIDLLEWGEMTVPNKIYEVIKSPVMFLILITTPVVDFDKAMNGWSRILNSLHCITAPVFWMLAFKILQNPAMKIGDFPAWLIPVIAGAVIGLVVFLTSKHWEPPRYHNAFAFLGFATAIVWIYTLANEVVNVLETLGLVLQISNAILGVTLLAWANSIGDVISNVVLARQGFPRIAISACFGGPLFNLLLGFGIPFLIKTAGEPGLLLDLKINMLQIMLTCFLLVSICISLVAFPLLKFNIRKPYGLVLIIYYVIFLVLAILTEVKVIEDVPI